MVPVLAAIIALTIASTSVLANSFSTDSWGCGWNGGSAGGSPTNYSWTQANSCALSAGVQVDWYSSGSWHSNSWVWSGTLYAQGNAIGILSSTHQIYVWNQGYGQVAYSAY